MALALLSDYALALRVARNILRDRESAYEAVQESVYRALLNAHTFQPGRPLRPWFLRIVRNVALDELKRRSHFVEMPELKDDRSPLEEALRAEEAGALRRVVADLPRTYRAVVHLRYDMGYKYRAISKAMCIPIGTTKTLLHRAHRAVKQKLSSHVP